MTESKQARLLVAVGGLACLAASASAFAQQVLEPRHVEVTPFVGYQSKETFTDETTASKLKLDSATSVGLIVDVDATPGSQYEFLYSQAKSPLAPERGGRELTDVKVEYLQAGGLLVFGDDHVRPFFGATLGVSRFSPEASRMDSNTFFALGLVGGVKFFLTKHVGLRFEARGFASTTNGNSSAFCNSGTCRIFYDGNILWQATANAGLVIGF